MVLVAGLSLQSPKVRFGGPMAVDSAEAKTRLLKDNRAQQIAEELGVFPWHTLKTPHGLIVYMDAVGNHMADEAVVNQACKTHQSKLIPHLKTLLGKRFPDVAIFPRPMATQPYGKGCCRKGCDGCLNGTKEVLLPLLDKQA